MTVSDFAQYLVSMEPLALDRAVGLLWFIGRSDPQSALSAKEISLTFERFGIPPQNITRLAKNLTSDRRVVKGGKGTFRLHPRERAPLDEKYVDAKIPTELLLTDSVLPFDLFSGTRTYIERVVEQINKSFDAQLWDCCAVMCRRLLETLIIECYEKLGEVSAIKGKDGNFLMLNGLITAITNNKAVNLGRNTQKGLADFKSLGDLSAHNRRFNAKKNDIERIRDGLRVTTEELLRIAGM